MEDVKQKFAESAPYILIHLAAVVRGIGANRENSRKFFLCQFNNGYSTNGNRLLE